MKNIAQKVPETAGSTAHRPPSLAPILMMTFWMLLGGAVGIKLAQSMWQILGWSNGDVSIAVPVGGVVGALAGAFLGLINNPRLLVLLMAVFAGASAGAVAGELAWGKIGEIGGQVVGGLVGGIAWAVWLFFERLYSDNYPSPPNGRTPAQLESVHVIVHASSEQRAADPLCPKEKDEDED